MKDIKCYHIYLWSSSNSSIEKSYDGYIISPIIVAGGLPNLVMLSRNFGSPRLASQQESVG
jgi:hypothetical protein